MNTPKQRAARLHNWTLYKLAGIRNAVASLSSTKTVGPTAKEQLEKIDFEMMVLRDIFRNERVDPPVIPG